MRFYKEVPSAVDPDVPVAVFKANREELAILLALLTHADRHVALFPELKNTMARVRQMQKVIDNYLLGRKLRSEELGKTQSLE